MPNALRILCPNERCGAMIALMARAAIGPPARENRPRGRGYVGTRPGYTPSVTSAPTSDISARHVAR
jgi:hypothetical protein